MATTTQLLAGVRAGDRAALDALLPRVYDELRALAHARLRRQRPGHTLHTTEIVHEAYLKLTAGETPGWESRAHFFALAARAMRFVLVGYARERTAQKRGGAARDLRLDSVLASGAEGLAAPGRASPEAAEAEALDLLSVDRALDRLAAHSERLAEVVELRFFGGMEHAEIAAVVGRSEPTVKRDWRRARAYLLELMHDDAPDRPAASGTSASGAGDPPEARPANGG